MIRDLHFEAQSVPYRSLVFPELNSFRKNKTLLQPKEAHDCDFSRVRLWAAEGKAKHYRQTIVFSHSENDLFGALLKQHGHNYRGRVELRGPQSVSQLTQITTPVPQVTTNEITK